LLDLLAVEQPFVLETHGGRGEIWKRLYSGFRGAVIEKDPERVEFLARQRPTWAVYEGKAEAMVGAGLFRRFQVDVLDVDPYGEPWPVIEGFFRTKQRKLAPRMVMAVNDGLRQNARVKGAWKVGSTKAAAKKYGNDKVRENYLEICREKVCEIAGAAGYSLAWWHGYYTGNLDDMTHYGALLVQSDSSLTGS
jgi:hypothetical protein